MIYGSAAYIVKYMEHTTPNTKPDPITEEAVTVGDIFCCSWGYDQTNIDYYEAVAVSKTGRVKIQMIDTQKIDSTQTTDVVAPVPGAYISEATGYKVPKFYECGGTQCYISINSYSTARRVARDAFEALTVTHHQTAWGYGH